MKNRIFKLNNKINKLKLMNFFNDPTGSETNQKRKSIGNETNRKLKPFQQNQNLEQKSTNSMTQFIDNKSIDLNSKKSKPIGKARQENLKQVVSITYEEIGLFPRSFNRVFDRFFKQLFFDVENLVVQEYRFYRYLFLTTVKSLSILLIVPLLINFFSKEYFIKPMVEYYWNSRQPEIFLNSYQQKQAFLELKQFEEKLYFETLIQPSPSLGLAKQMVDFPRSANVANEFIHEKKLQAKTLELAISYNEESIEAITNFFADLISFGTLWFLVLNLEIQINISKSFLAEVFFGLDDSKKSLLILFLTDLLVGYHSPNIWELMFSTFFEHYGLPENQTTIFLLVATLPVLLDVLFKYLIFRHLNRASPATVATYHAMIE